MRLLILIYCVTLTGCGWFQPRIEYRATPLVVPDSLISPVAKPNRPLATYKDAVVRDAERGAVIDQLLEDRAQVRGIVLEQ